MCLSPPSYHLYFIIILLLLLYYYVSLLSHYSFDVFTVQTTRLLERAEWWHLQHMMMKENFGIGICCWRKCCIMNVYSSTRLRCLLMTCCWMLASPPWFSSCSWDVKKPLARALCRLTLIILLITAWVLLLLDGYNRTSLHPFFVVIQLGNSVNYICFAYYSLWHSQ